MRRSSRLKSKKRGYPSSRLEISSREKKKKKTKKNMNNKRNRKNEETGRLRIKRVRTNGKKKITKKEKEIAKSPHLSVHSAAKEVLRRKHYHDFLQGENLSYVEAYRREIEEDSREVEAAIILQKRWRGHKGRDFSNSLKFRKEMLERKKAKLFERSFFRAFGVTAIVLCFQILPVLLILLKNEHVNVVTQLHDTKTCVLIVVIFASLIRFSHNFQFVLGEGSTAAVILSTFVGSVCSLIFIFTYGLCTVITQNFISKHDLLKYMIRPLLSVIIGTFMGICWRWKTVSAWTHQHIKYETKFVTDDLLDHLDTGDIVFHSGGDYLSRIIKFFTNSHASHVGIIVKDPSVRVRKAYDLKMPTEEIMESTSLRKVRGRGRKKRRRKKTRKKNTTKDRVFVLETVFGRRGHAVEMMSLRDWIREYVKSDGKEDYTCFVRHLLLPDYEYIHSHHPLDDLLIPLRNSEYEPNFMSIVYSVLRLQIQSSMKHIFCSELVAAVLQHITVLSHSVGQSDCLPGDFEPSPNGGISLDKKYMRHSVKMGPLIRLLLTKEDLMKVGEESREYTAETVKSDSFSDLKYLYHFLFPSQKEEDET